MADTMHLSVGYNGDCFLLDRLGAFPEVREVYGKLDRDIVGGGRSTYTLQPVSRKSIARAIQSAHHNGIRFNYLLNGASLDGLEQTRAGRHSLRRLIDWVSEAGADSVTVAAPFLLRMVKKHYPHLAVRISVFAVIDSALKARQWEEMGADTLCLSAIACNRNFDRLQTIRRAVSCELQLIANASCLLHCAYELTHMNLLSASSRSNRSGFCLDHCFLHCSRRRLLDPVNFVRTTWIRPEDCAAYEALGFHSFKLVERSSSSDLIVKRVRAYHNRSFDGNLLEIAGPVARIRRERGMPLRQYLRMLVLLARPDKNRIGIMLAMKQYAEAVIPATYSRERAPVFIDNKKLDGYLAGIQKRGCPADTCDTCGYCSSWAEKTVRIDATYRQENLSRSERLVSALTG